MPDLARGAVLEPLLQELHAPRDLVELPDAGVLVDRVLDDREQRSDLLAPFLHAGGVRGGSRRLVAVALEVLRIAAVQGRRSLLVVRGGRQRDRRAVLLALLRRPVGPADVLAQERERLVELLEPPDVFDRQTVEELALDRPVDVLGIAGGHRGGKAAEVLDHVLGLLGDAREPRLLAEHVEEARLAEEELRLPARPEARRRVPYDREPEPTVPR